MKPKHTRIPVNPNADPRKIGKTGVYRHPDSSIDDLHCRNRNEIRSAQNYGYVHVRALRKDDSPKNDPMYKERNLAATDARIEYDNEIRTMLKEGASEKDVHAKMQERDKAVDKVLKGGLRHNATK